MSWRDDPARVRPMLATLAEPPLTGKGLVFEPKYDGIRAIVHVAPGTPRPDIRLWSRLGNEKTSQFPTVIRALEPLGRRSRAPLLLDGEIVALDEHGRPAGFQRLQGRIHVKGTKEVEALDRRQPTAFIAFDLLRDGTDDLRGLPLTARRERLERRLRTHLSPALRLSEQAAADGTALHERATAEGWEGLIVKEAGSPYQSGRRSPAWRKLKLLNEEEFIVGGWTEPRNTRSRFGALLLGIHEDRPGRPLVYVGHTGTGFGGKELDRVWALLQAREVPQSPFSGRIKTNERAHWVRPDLVAQVRFTEWTADRKLRHPVYLGLRDDKRPASVARKPPAARARDAKPAAVAASARQAAKPKAVALTAAQRQSILGQLRELEEARRDGTIELPGDLRLGVTNPAKVFWPGPGLTKGDLLRYYVEVAPLILPAVADRPLVMKRFPNGIDKPAFYQHRARAEQPPAGVRRETVAGGEVEAPMLIGGNLITLLYMAQIAAISQDPWFARVQSPLDADYVALDLDPGDATPFTRVLEVARLIRDELASLRVPAVPKTSGSSGLHIYIPLPPSTSYESGVLFCQVIATLIATRHPKLATVERRVRARPKGSVYVDYLQNIPGKTLATAYSARASEFAGVSTPLTWEELDEPIDPHDFTIVSAPKRFAGRA